MIGGNLTVKVSLKNVGMLDEAEFEVGDLTIICGENNTGKTYATYSLYGYLDFVRGDTNYVIFDLLKNITENYVDILDEYRIKIYSKNMEKIIANLFEELESNYKTNLAAILAGRDEDFDSSVFSTSSKEAMISYIKYDNNEYHKKNIKEFFSHSPQFELVEITEQYFLFSYEKSKNHFNEKMQKDANYRKESFVLALLNYITIISHPVAFILSAERTGASMFQKELDVNKNEIVEKISRADTKNIQQTVFNVLNSNYSRYPKPVKDNIYFVRELDEVSKKVSFIKQECSVLHKEIIELLYKIVGGKYIVSEIGIEFAPGAKQRITKGKFLIQRASSSVRSLLMLNYYILHIAQSGNILMIDEPELNLHPNNQVFMGRLIALLVNAGIKVFITTHSDYIVRELSNCIMLNNLTDEQISRFQKSGYTKEYKLKPNKVRAYVAQNNNRKNILREIKVDSIRGIFMNTFDEPINSQNENQGFIFEEIYNGLRYDE